MTAFSSEWLALRESTDAASRNSAVADALSSRFILRDRIGVLDLGCGTGANLRATAPLLPAKQSWRLVDNDAGLLEDAKRALCRWADRFERIGDGSDLVLMKDRIEVRASFIVGDLSRQLDELFAPAPDLVTASAFFDLVSEDFIRRLARLATEQGTALYATLTFNGRQSWRPHRPADNRIAAAFHRHQLRDKGFGPAAGPAAAALLSDYFRVSGYSVIEGDSPWRLGDGDRSLLSELVRGYAIAATETGEVDNGTVETWVKVNRSAAEIGHTDLFAAPA